MPAVGTPVAVLSRRLYPTPPSSATTTRGSRRSDTSVAPRSPANAGRARKDLHEELADARISRAAAEAALLSAQEEATRAHAEAEAERARTLHIAKQLDEVRRQLGASELARTRADERSDRLAHETRALSAQLTEALSAADQRARELSASREACTTLQHSLVRARAQARELRLGARAQRDVARSARQPRTLSAGVRVALCVPSADGLLGESGELCVTGCTHAFMWTTVDTRTLLVAHSSAQRPHTSLALGAVSALSEVSADSRVRARLAAAGGVPGLCFALHFGSRRGSSSWLAFAPLADDAPSGAGAGGGGALSPCWHWMHSLAGALREAGLPPHAVASRAPRLLWARARAALERRAAELRVGRAPVLLCARAAAAAALRRADERRADAEALRAHKSAEVMSLFLDVLNFQLREGSELAPVTFWAQAVPSLRRALEDDALAAACTARRDAAHTRRLLQNAVHEFEPAPAARDALDWAWRAGLEGGGLPTPVLRSARLLICNRRLLLDPGTFPGSVGVRASPDTDARDGDGDGGARGTEARADGAEEGGAAPAEPCAAWLVSAQLQPAVDASLQRERTALERERRARDAGMRPRPPSARVVRMRDEINYRLSRLQLPRASARCEAALGAWRRALAPPPSAQLCARVQLDAAPSAPRLLVVPAGAELELWTAACACDVAIAGAHEARVLPGEPWRALTPQHGARASMRLALVVPGALTAAGATAAPAGDARADGAQSAAEAEGTLVVEAPAWSRSHRGGACAAHTPVPRAQLDAALRRFGRAAFLQAPLADAAYEAKLRSAEREAQLAAHGLRGRVGYEPAGVAAGPEAAAPGAPRLLQLRPAAARTDGMHAAAPPPAADGARWSGRGDSPPPITLGRKAVPPGGGAPTLPRSAVVPARPACALAADARARAPAPLCSPHAQPQPQPQPPPQLPPPISVGGQSPAQSGTPSAGVGGLGAALRPGGATPLSAATTCVPSSAASASSTAKSATDSPAAPAEPAPALPPPSPAVTARGGARRDAAVAAGATPPSATASERTPQPPRSRLALSAQLEILLGNYVRAAAEAVGCASRLVESHAAERAGQQGRGARAGPEPGAAASPRTPRTPAGGGARARHARTLGDAAARVRAAADKLPCPERPSVKRSIAALVALPSSARAAAARGDGAAPADEALGGVRSQLQRARTYAARACAAAVLEAEVLAEALGTLEHMSSAAAGTPGGARAVRTRARRLRRPLLSSVWALLDEVLVEEGGAPAPAAAARGGERVRAADSLIARLDGVLRAAQDEGVSRHARAQQRQPGAAVAAALPQPLSPASQLPYHAATSRAPAVPAAPPGSQLAPLATPQRAAAPPATRQPGPGVAPHSSPRTRAARQRLNESLDRQKGELLRRREERRRRQSMGPAEGLAVRGARRRQSLEPALLGEPTGFAESGSLEADEADGCGGAPPAGAHRRQTLGAVDANALHAYRRRIGLDCLPTRERQLPEEDDGDGGHHRIAADDALAVPHGVRPPPQ